MTVVFVHGSPETAKLWDPVRARIGAESVALELPGFGVPRPDGFTATMDAYADWLVEELAATEGPIDLVGHDWGGILTTRVVTTDAVALRSWVTDAVTVLDPDFTWHDLAKVWQTPEEGEAYWESIRATPADAAALLAAFGVPEPDALTMAEAVDETMAACILDLYRSATDIGRAWATDSAVTAPGLVLVGSDDAFGDEAASRATAERLGAAIAVIEGAGHWWPLQAPDAAAAALEEFWAALDRS